MAVVSRPIRIIGTKTVFPVPCRAGLSADGMTGEEYSRTVYTAPNVGRRDAAGDDRQPDLRERDKARLQMNEKVYLNGDIIDLAKAVVTVSNPSLLHGVGLFETLRAYDGRAFLLQRHIDRMTDSAKHFDMPVLQLVEQIPDAVAAVLAANRLKNARIRFTVMPPGAQDGHERSTLLVAAQETAGYPPVLYERGMTVHLNTRWRQSDLDPLAGHKTTSYFSRLLALRDAQAAGCGEGLWFTPENRLAQGCISNVFVVKEGVLRTPPLDTPVVPGITRQVVIELATEAGVKTEQVPLTVNDLLDADEVFLTNSVMEIMPVTRIERKAVSNEKPGPITGQLQQAYNAMTRQTKSTS
ncbi:MAG TPA: aminotransferase class IV [Phycisphaerae bacterium]|nr:aminotransferase class IV [Phycisphaerae bacterium]HRR85659.1 aminotransferase class IV [Phycisphaerae bacterium]